MNGTIERQVEQEKYLGLASYWPDTGNPFFEGVLRRYHLERNKIR
jgi:hypothetical protein